MSIKKISGKLKLAFSALFMVMIIFIYLFTQTTSELGKYKKISRLPNQACVGLNYGALTNKSLNFSAQFNLEKSDSSKTASFTCLVDQFTQSTTIQGKHIDAYEFGAYATYFTDDQSALDYAEKQLNPLRYWGIDQAGQQAGIPQTSLFTFIVSDVPEPYYDAYTVKNNSLLRISLPCGDPDVSHGGVSCYAEAQSAISTFANNVERLEI
jgi:hypothetical protein